MVWNIKRKRRRKKVQIFSSAGFLWLNILLINIFYFKFQHQGAAMLVLVHSLAMKSRKRLATKYEYVYHYHYMINAEIWYRRNLILFCHTCWPCHWWNWYYIVESARQKMAASVASYMILIVLDLQTTLSNKSSMYTWLNSCGCSLLLLFH